LLTYFCIKQGISGKYGGSSPNTGNKNDEQKMAVSVSPTLGVEIA